MQVFIRKPSIDMLCGIRVTKDTEIEFKNEKVSQKIKDLVMESVVLLEGENYKSKYETTIQLNEGDVLIFEEEGRGYIKPVESFVTVAEAIDDLTNIKDIGGE